MVMFLLSSSLNLFAIFVPFSWGREPERQGAKVVAAMFLLSILRLNLFGIRLYGLDYIGIFIDIVGLAAFLLIALFAMRVWPLWAAALQLIAVTAHLVMVFDIHVHPMAYLLMRYAPSYLVSATLVIVCIRMRLSGSVSDNKPCWRNWSAQSIQGRQKR